MSGFFIFIIYFLLVPVDLYGSILNIGGKDYSLFSFYSRYPKQQWERADSLQKAKMYNDFVNRELCILEAKGLGLENDPKIAVKIKNRSMQVLINESYEFFVANPLVPKENIDLARKNAKKELFINHILIAHREAFIKNPPKRTLDDALILAQKIKGSFDKGDDFVILAEKYSNDPSVNKDGGALGWVRWGATVPQFQKAAFNLEKGVLSQPVLTDFGYHLILVSEERPSELADMPEGAYEEYIINLSKNSIRGELRSAALEYDANMLIEHGVFFNDKNLYKILEKYNILNKKNSLSQAPLPSSDELLNQLNGVGVVVIYGQKGFGPKWFANKLSKMPTNRQPRLGSIEEIKSAFKTIILQDIAIKRGVEKGVDKSFVYNERRDILISELLYDAYLNHLVNSIPPPSDKDVDNYYNKNISQYSNDEKIVIREIRVSNKPLADSLLSRVEKGEDFVLLAQEFSSINPSEGGLVLPFSKKDNSFIFKIANQLDVEAVSPTINLGNGYFSIIKLINRLPGKPKKIDDVRNEITSKIINEKQALVKDNNFNKLLKKHTVVLKDFLSF
tara:strand:- start:355 stop:2043 length:1689 start_codon:yes stop_codon:yes gene_type:complete